MTKILITLSILFSVTAFAGDRGGNCGSGDGHGGGCGNTWPDFKSECQRNGGYASPVPSQCAAAYAASLTTTSITYTSLQDGNSANQKCCIKCSGESSVIGASVIPSAAKCESGRGFVLQTNPAKCCFRKQEPTPSPTPTPRQVQTSVAVKTICFPGTIAVVPQPANGAQGCIAAGFTWGMNLCCKAP